MSESDPSNSVSVPKGRLSRMARFGGLASGIAGNMLVDGAKTLAKGERTTARDLLLTPRNAGKVADELSRLRGAAMKVGQLISMDGGDLIPPELADILSRLRQNAHSMPPRQLDTVLRDNWGRDWRRKVRRFEATPMAAASIGQVHRAVALDGTELAIKIQYPGVRESIDSDVDNVATLIRVSGLLPKHLDVGFLLAEAKRQLHVEADYEQEGAFLDRYGAILSGDDRFLVPGRDEALTTKNVLAMTYLDGVAIERLGDLPQEERDRVTTLLIDLVLRELFDFRLMQTDPNFANYRYQRGTGKIILLDFGATREVPEDFTTAYRKLLRAGVEGDRDRIREAALAIGSIDETTPEDLVDRLMVLFEMALEPFRLDGAFDFGTSDLVARLRDAGVEIGEERKEGPMPPIDALYIHRKIAGIYLLASRLEARVRFREVLHPYLYPDGDA